MEVSTITKTFNTKDEAYFFIFDEQLRLSKSNCKWSKIVELKQHIITSMAVVSPSSLYPNIVHYNIKWGIHSTATTMEVIANDD